MFSDYKTLTDAERQHLCELLYYALLEIRLLGWEKKAEQAADLADAFHNLPSLLWSDNFSLNFFRNFLADYQQQYPERRGLNYLDTFDKMIKANTDSNLKL